MQFHRSSSFLNENQEQDLVEFPQINGKKNNTVSPKKKAYCKPIVVNLSETQYEVVEEVCEDMNWRIQYDRDHKNWDIKWIDSTVTIDMLAKMASHQKINHFPGMNILSRKNNLSKSILKMQSEFPEHYNFCPRTFLLPQDCQKLKSYYHENKRRGITKTFIVKPEASSQGRGIFLTQNLNQIELYEHCIVQKYITNPLLYKGLKFDLRIYALVAGCDPLRVYIYNEGLVRFATQKYEYPSEENMDNLYMHLTNYAINKDNPKYVFNDSVDNLSHGHKKSLAEFFQTLKSLGLKAHHYWSEIKDIIVKTLISGQPHLAHQYRMGQPNNYSNNMCFEVLGFDFMIDGNHKCSLLEINYTPSFSTETPLDELIKSNVIRDTLLLMDINQKSRNQILSYSKMIQDRRVYTGKTLKLSVEERRQVIEQFQKKRDQYQSENIGSFERICPNKNHQRQSKYLQFVQYSQMQYKNTTTGVKIHQIRRSNSKYRIKRIQTNQTTCEEENREENKQENKQENQTKHQKASNNIDSQRNKRNIVEKSDVFKESADYKLKNQNNQFYNPKVHERGSSVSKKDKVSIFNETAYNNHSNSIGKPFVNFRTKNQEQTMFSKQMKIYKNNNQ